MSITFGRVFLSKAITYSPFSAKLTSRCEVGGKAYMRLRTPVRDRNVYLSTHLFFCPLFLLQEKGLNGVAFFVGTVEI